MDQIDLDQYYKKVGMYFDKCLDPQGCSEVEQQAQSNPDFQNAFDNEKKFRDHLKDRIYKPQNSSQLASAIKNNLNF